MPFALVGLVLAWAVMMVFGAQEFDRGLLLILYGGNDPRLTQAAHWVTLLGDTPVLLAATGLGAIVLLIRREWRSAAMLLAITLSGRLLVPLQTDWAARIRSEAQGQFVAVDSLAFPSSHAANATMVWVCLALLLPANERSRGFAVWGAVWLALAIGVSRVMLQVWPSDVIGGWAFGLFWTLLLFHLSGLRVNEGTPARVAHSVEEGGQE